MTSSILLSIVVVLCLVEGCVCPNNGAKSDSDSRGKSNSSNRGSRFFRSISSPNLSSFTTLSQMGVFNLADPSSKFPVQQQRPPPSLPKNPVLQSRPTLSHNPTELAQEQFYNQRILQPNSSLGIPSRGNKLSSDFTGIVMVDRDWIDAQNTDSNDPLITARDDQMVDYVCEMYKSRMIVIEMSGYQDANIQSCLRILVNKYHNLVVIRAFFTICPGTRNRYGAHQTPTFAILSNGNLEHVVNTISDLQEKMVKVNRSHTLSQTPRVAAYQNTNQQTSRMPSQNIPLPPARQSQGLVPRRQLSYLPSSGQASSSSSSSGSDVYVATNDTDFLNTLLALDKDKCILVEVTNMVMSTIGPDRSYLEWLSANHKRLSIIRVVYEKCPATAETFKAKTLFPTFILFGRDRTLEPIKIHSTMNGYESILKTKLTNELSQHNCK